LIKSTDIININITEVAPPPYFLSSDPKRKSYGESKNHSTVLDMRELTQPLKSLQATLSEMSHDSFASNFRLSSQDSSSNTQRHAPQTIQPSPTTRCWWILREVTNKLAQAQCFCKHVLALQNRKVDDTLHFDGACRHLEILWTAPYLIFAVQADSRTEDSRQLRKEEPNRIGL
jgi:hypothetical protein